MPFGLFFDGMSDTSGFIAFASEAERLGIGSVWVAEHFCFRDAFVVATALLKETKSMGVVPGPVSPYSRHPMTLAMGATSLSELAPGRVGLHLGTGNLSAQQEFGVYVKRPLRTMREAIETIRELMTGDFVHYQGQQFAFDGVKMGFTAAPVPIYLAAIGPKMLATAGTYADGVVLSAGLSPEFVARSLETVRAARVQAERGNRPFKRVGFIVASAAPDSGEAYDNARQLLSYLFRTPFLVEDWALHGINIDHEAILAAIRKRDWDTAKSYVSDEAVALHSISGSPVQFKDRLQAYLDAGLDLPVIKPLGPPERQRLALELALEVCGPAPEHTRGAS